MERLDALTITNRLEAAYTHERWTEVRLDQWIDALLDLDAGAAGTALVRYTRTHPKAPTIAEFRAAVHQLRTHDAAHPAERCPDCDGTGWVEVLTDARHNPNIRHDGPCTCHAVTECRCSRPTRQEHT